MSKSNKEDRFDIEMQYRNKRLLIAVIFMIALITILIILIKKVNSEGFECTQNPILYGVRNLDWIDNCACNSQVDSCTCISLNNTAFRVTKRGMEYIE